METLEVVATDHNCMVGWDGTQYGWERYSRRVEDDEVPEGYLRVFDHDDELWVPEGPAPHPLPILDHEMGNMGGHKR